MQARSQTSTVVIYFGALATAIAVTALGLTAVVKASVGLSSATAREKTRLEMQVENSREIRRALAVPVTITALPPITAHLARDRRETMTAQQRHSLRAELPQAALDAMAMDQSAAYPEARSSSRAISVPDRHSANW